MTEQEDLGFTYRATAQGTVLIFRAGRAVVTLRRDAASRFLARAEGASPEAIQQLCARVTGNYKRVESAASAARRENLKGAT